MQAPIFPKITNWLRVLTWKLVTEVLVSSLATLVAMAIYSDLHKPLPSVPPGNGQQSLVAEGSAEGETVDSTDDFVERIALSHIRGPKTPSKAPSEEVMAAKGEISNVSTAPLSPRPPAVQRHERLASGKSHVAASVPKALPPVKPPLAAAEPAAASAPITPAKAEPLPPLEFGMHLVNNLGTMIAASETHVVEGVASVGNTLTSLVKKL